MNRQVKKSPFSKNTDPIMTVRTAETEMNRLAKAWVEITLEQILNEKLPRAKGRKRIDN